MRKTLIHGVAALAILTGSTAAMAQEMDHSAHAEQATSAPMDHSAHAEQAASAPMDHSAQNMNHAEHMAAMNDDVAGAEAVLTSYRSALTTRDADAMAALFAEESFVYENGKDEGSFTHYMEHHLGPELGAITSFTFEEPTLAVTRMGHLAYARETYKYKIELADGRVIDREGVATSVLSHNADGWKIVQYHSSSRAPR